MGRPEDPSKQKVPEQNNSNNIPQEALDYSADCLIDCLAKNNPFQNKLQKSKEKKQLKLNKLTDISMII